MADEIEGRQDEDLFAPSRNRTYQFVQLDVAQGIARISLNRAPANVLSIEMMEELNSALESLEFEREVKLVVLTGGPKYFSAGFEVADHLGDRAYVMHESFGRVFENMAKLDKPTPLRGGGRRARSRLHPRRRLRHRPRRGLGQVRPPGDQGGRLQPRGRGAAAAPGRTKESLRTSSWGASA